MDCFEDESLRAEVEAAGHVGGQPCEYCGSNSKQVDAEYLSAMFARPVRDHFMLLEDRADARHLDASDGESLDDLLDNELGPVFSERVANRSRLLGDILNGSTSMGEVEAFDVEAPWCNQEEDPPSRTYTDYWFSLASAVSNFGHSLVVGERFLGDREEEESYGILRDELRLLTARIGRRTPLWRSRRGKGHTKKDLAAPPPELARAGRGNIQGQRVLYASGDKKTSVYEVRPSVGDVVSVAKFVLRTSADICDLVPHYEATTPFVRDDASYAAYRKACARNQLRQVLGKALAEPVRAGDEDKDYLATQFLCKMIAGMKFDGIAYSSSQREPRRARRRQYWATPARKEHRINYLFFDPDLCEQVSDPEMIRVKSVRYDIVADMGE